jgi:hypothetical protein
MVDMATQKGREFEHFGDVVRYLRETYMRRMAGDNAGLLRVRVTAQTVIGCLAEKGLQLSSGQYSEIESGIILPRDPQDFMEKVASCLGVGPDSAEYQVLQKQLAYDILSRRLGAENMESIMERPWLRVVSELPD